MGDHRFRATPAGDWGWVARCTCRWTGDRPAPTKQAAEDLHLTHLRNVERARAGIVRRPPSLKVSRDHYRAQAADETLPPEERRLWGQMADEIDRRLNEAGSRDGTQGTLW